MDQQCHYVGLDVSLETTSICVIDDAGAIIWRGKCSSDPDAIAATVRPACPRRSTGWSGDRTAVQLADAQLAPTRRARGLHGRPARLSLQINKTGANDTFGLAQVVRTGWYREVAVKSMDAHTLRMLLVARSRLVSQRRQRLTRSVGCSRPLACLSHKAAKPCFLCAFASRSPTILYSSQSSSRCLPSGTPFAPR